MPNIPEALKTEKKIKIINEGGVPASALNRTVRGKGPFTVFAPSDHTFDKIASETAESIVKPENKTPHTTL